MSDNRGDRYGRHRVLEPEGALPQAAERLDPPCADFAKVFDDEVVIDVEVLNIDSASFRQIEESVRKAGAGDADVDAAIGRVITDTVAARGKQHNRVTGSGGMLLGRVARIGAHVADVVGLGRGVKVGDRVATLVSLTLTPLAIERVVEVRRGQHQVVVVGRAVLFASGQLAKLPVDLPETLALAVLDVAGAAPQVARLVRKGDSVLVLGGGGKSGILACAAARRAVGDGGKVVAVEGHAPYARDLVSLCLCDHVLVADAREALSVRDKVVVSSGGPARGFDVVVSCVNVPDVEMSAILAVRDGGIIYFFSMATSFTQAALGAEGISRDVTMIVGNGYCPGHAEATLSLLREMPALRDLLAARYAPSH